MLVHRERNIAYSLCAIIPLSFEIPAFCTPLFKRPDSKSYFVQKADGQRIFGFIETTLAPRFPLPYRSNVITRSGDDLVYAFRDRDGSILVNTRRNIYARLIDNIYDYYEFDFLYYNLVTKSGDLSFYKSLIRSENVQRNIERGLLPIPGLNGRSGKWQVADLMTLLQYWADGRPPREGLPHLKAPTVRKMVKRIERAILNGYAG